MKKRVLLFIPALGISYGATAQKLSPDILATAGGSNRTAAIQLDWTLGETAVETVATPAQIFTQGFHQPDLQVIPMPVKGNSALQDDYKVAPNPAVSQLIVYLPVGRQEETRFILADLNGKVLLSKTAGFQRSKVELALAPYAEGLYLLHVQNASGTTLQTFKIIKAR